MVLASGFIPASAVPAADRAGAEPEGSFAPPFRRWHRESEAKRITDLSVATPRDALAPRRQKGKWKVIPYATAAFSGKALVTGPETGAAEVSVPLAAAGWHAVYVGVANVARGGTATDDGIWARISGDSGWRRLRNTVPLGDLRREVIEEVYLTTADLTGKDIQFRQMPFVNGAVMFVKIVPLDREEEEGFRDYLTANPFRTMIATFDAHAMIWQNRPRTAEDLRVAFDGFDESDFGKWWYQIGGADITHYPTKVGTVLGSLTEDFARWEDREYAESVQHLIRNGVHALKVAREIARENRAEFHVFVRPASWLSSVPWEENFRSRFAADHPEWRCMDRDGTPALYMSYAYPEVRRQIVDILRESLEVDPDGVGLFFHRGVPLILWEDAFVRAYQAKHGKDPREVPEDDPTIGKMRGEILTTLMREIRAMLDEAARASGRKTPYRLSVAALATEADNLRHGIDIERWIKEGLVDGDVAPANFAAHIKPVPPDIAYYRKITAGTKVGLYPMFRAYRPGAPQEFLKKMLGAYEAGADGIAVWDPVESYTWGTKASGQPVGQVFDFFRFLGHRALLARWASSGIPQPALYPLTQFGDNFYSRWYPGSGL